MAQACVWLLWAFWVELRGKMFTRGQAIAPRACSVHAAWLGCSRFGSAALSFVGFAFHSTEISGVCVFGAGCHVSAEAVSPHRAAVGAISVSSELGENMAAARALAQSGLSLDMAALCQRLGGARSVYSAMPMGAT